MRLQLLEDQWKQHLSEVLLYHVAAGNVSSTDLFDGMVVTMLNEENVTVAISGDTVTLNGAANVTLPDIFRDNGVAHVINAVLVPSFLGTNIVDIASSATTTLASLVVSAELVSVLSDAAGAFTVRTFLVQ
jgi:hypothetical protein